MRWRSYNGVLCGARCTMNNHAFWFAPQEPLVITIADAIVM